MRDKDIIELNRRNRNLGRYILIMFGLIVLCVFIYLLTSGPLYYYFLWEDHTSLPYMSGLAIAFHSVFLAILYLASTMTTAILVKKGRKHRTVVLTMLGFIAVYNIAPWLLEERSPRMGLALTLKVYILYIAVPTLLFLHL